MNDIPAIVGAVACNVSAQIMMKIASRAHFGLEGGLARGVAALLNPWIIAALVTYGASFVLTIIAYRRNPLNILSPTMAGAIIALIVIAGLVLFAETVSHRQLLGLLLIIAGIVLLTA